MSRVLLVDDNSNVLLTLAIALRRRGHDVTTAANGTQALAQLYNHTFDVVVSDVRMPDMSGVQLANLIRRRKHAPRVILTSAYSTLEAHYDVAEAFLCKPVDVTQLDDLLNRQPPSPSSPTSTRRVKRRGRRKNWFSLRAHQDQIQHDSSLKPTIGNPFNNALLI